MHLTISHPDAPRALITLDGRPIECIEANDEEGWVVVLDLASMVDMDIDNETELDITDINDENAYDDDGPVISDGQGIEMKTKKRYGKVLIIIKGD